MRLGDLIGEVVEFTAGVERTEVDFDPGMRAEVIDAREREDDVVRVTFDFREFAEYNKSFAKPTYYDDNGNAALRWHESRFYPNNFRCDDYFDKADLVGGRVFKVVGRGDSRLKVVRHKIMAMLEANGVRTNGVIDGELERILSELEGDR